MASRITLEGLDARIRGLEAELEKSRRSQRVKLDVPQPCQSSIRRVVEQLKKATDNPLVLTYNSKDEDDEGMKRVVKETRRLFGDQGWSVGTCEEAFWRTWTNKRDDLRRKNKGKAEAHRLAAKKNKRIKTKLESRKKALVSIDWPERRKLKVLSVLRTDCTSPVVSDEEDDNLLLSTRFSWESRKLSHYKRHLDNQRIFSAPARGRNKMKTWSRHATVTEQSLPPKDIPDWAVMTSGPADLNDTVEYDC